MNIILMPFFIFSSLITGIQVSSNQVIKSTVLVTNTKADQDYLAFKPSDFILLKTLVESKNDDCKTAIKDSISICQYQLDTCYSTCDSNPKYYKDMIATLQFDLVNKKDKIKSLAKSNTLLKYVAIGLGSIALTATTYSIIK